MTWSSYVQYLYRILVSAIYPLISFAQPRIDNILGGGRIEG